VALSGDLLETYRVAISKLLPTGTAWRRDEESNLQKLVLAYAVELATVDGRLRTLLEEADPRTALELLDDWERFVGLPSPCTGPLDDLTQRRNAIVAKLTRSPSASVGFFQDFADRLGYQVQVLEFRSFRAGSSGAGDRLSNVQVGFRAGVSGAGDRLENSTGWAFAWAIRSNGATSVYFRAGSSGAGDRLRLVGSSMLECSFREIAPAHTVLLFFYFNALDPQPARLALGAPDRS
jgi:uncharacterized protein YmfQ (DUF2313 family)